MASRISISVGRSGTPPTKTSTHPRIWTRRGPGRWGPGLDVSGFHSTGQGGAKVAKRRGNSFHSVFSFMNLSFAQGTRLPCVYPKGGDPLHKYTSPAYNVTPTQIASQPADDCGVMVGCDVSASGPHIAWFGVHSEATVLRLFVAGFICVVACISRFGCLFP